MKNKRIIRAYDSVNPSLSDKQRMLDAILAEADQKEDSPKQPVRRNPNVCATRPTKSHKRGNLGALAAALAMILMAGFILVQMVRQPEEPVVYADPTEMLIPEKTAQDHYAPILEKYRQAIADGWTKEQCEIEGISPRVQIGADVTHAGYVFLDLDGDGREELIIAEQSISHISNVWDLYTTLEDGTPIQLWVDECDGGQCRLYEDNIISISYSNKHELDLTFYDLEAGQLVMREMLQWEDEDTVFYTDANGNTRQVTSREGQEIGYAHDGLKLDLTWLAEKQVSAETEEMTGYEVFDQIIQKYFTAINEGWTAHRCEENDISPQIFEGLAGYQYLGWCLLDIDKNGVEELIISDGVYLYDLYVMMPHDGSPGHLICGNGGETWQLCENGVIQNQGLYSGTAAWRYYTLVDIDIIQRDIVFYDGELNQYYYGADGEDLEPIPKDKAGDLISRERTAELTLTPFVEQPLFWPDEAEYYEPVLNIYRQAVREYWNPGVCVENGISLMVGYYGDFVEELGYTTVDLDGNGIDELIITDGTNIYDLYTIVQDEETGPLRLVDAMERIQYFLTTDGKIYCMGSGSASVSYYALYSLEGRELKLMEGYMMDYETNPSSPWFYYDGTDRGDPCPTSVAARVMDSIHFAEISFIPFG